MHFCNTFDDNNCSVSSGFVRFRQVSFGFVEKGYRLLTCKYFTELCLHDCTHGLRYHYGNWTLRTQDRLALRHFGTVQVGPKCPDISAPVPKCPEDTSDLSTGVSSPMVRTVPPYGPKCPTLWSEVSHLRLRYM